MSTPTSDTAAAGQSQFSTFEGVVAPLIRAPEPCRAATLPLVGSDLPRWAELTELTRGR